MTLIVMQAAQNPLEPVSNSHAARTMTLKKAPHKWRTFRSTRLTIAAFGLLLVAAPGYAQTIRKETTMTRLSTLQLEGAPQTATAEIRPFHINVLEEQLLDLRRRIVSTQWPERETVGDATQGVQLATMQKLAHYWVTEYDWRKAEARLNALPQFLTTIDDIDIHFIHVRSKNPHALPVIITHGWPGSIIEQLKIIGPLTDPVAYGGKAEDAFDVVIPSLPGYGFSGKPDATGWDPIRVARAWVVLMKRLGYTRFVAQGGDWGNAVTEQMALLGAPELIGIHTNMPATVPDNVAKALQFGQPAPTGLSAEEQGAWEQLDFFYKHGLGYAQEMANRPQTLYGIADSPIGLASWMLDHDARSQALIARVFDGQSEGLTRDDILDNVTLYWLTNTAVSSARLYWESKLAFFAPKGVPVPTAVSVFPDEIYSAPRSWTEKAYPNLIYYNRLPKGGHFAAWEQPELFSEEMRAAFRPLRSVSAARHTGIRLLPAKLNVAVDDTDGTSIRPFHINVSEQQLVDLRGRLANTRWPDRETVSNQTQGVQLAKIQPLMRYWETEYDWRKAEAKLNALPQFVTKIDGVDIQFVHIRSRYRNAMPLLMTHGWPGSIFELMKVIGPLTDPPTYGGRAEDAFDLVLPTWPGYGFSGKPTDIGWTPDRVGRAWAELMRRLGYTRYVSQGGDWGAIVSEAMARQALPGLLGIHVNMPATVPPDVAKILASGGAAPANLSISEKAAFSALDGFYKKGAGYAAIMNTRPQTIGYSLADSPVGMAAFYYDKFAAWSDSGGEPERVFTRDEILDNISLYWLTNTGTSSSQSYWEVWGVSPFNAVDISIPVAVTVFPGEIYRAPRSWAEQNFHNLIYWHEVDKGGHFAAWEQPELFTEEVRAAFRSLR